MIHNVRWPMLLDDAERRQFEDENDWSSPKSIKAMEPPAEPLWKSLIAMICALICAVVAVSIAIAAS